VKAAEAAESTGPYSIEGVSSDILPPGVVRSFNAVRMQLNSEQVSQPGLREYLRLGWHVYGLLAGQELTRRGVQSGNDFGAFLLDLAAEWFAVQQFTEDAGMPMFRSAPAPVAAGDVGALGSAVGAGLAGSRLHTQEVEAWLGRHGGSPFARITQDLLASLCRLESPRGLFDALASRYRVTRQHMSS
jgi:hypothetical protein